MDSCLLTFMTKNTMKTYRCYDRKIFLFNSNSSFQAGTSGGKHFFSTLSSYSTLLPLVCGYALCSFLLYNIIIIITIIIIIITF